MKIIKRLLSFGTALLLSTASLLIFAPSITQAAPCTLNASGGGGVPFIGLSATADTVDSTVKKVGFEATPVTAFTTVGYGLTGGIRFANSSCADINSSADLRIDKNKQLSISFYDNNRTVPFASGTDYTNVIAGGSVTSSSNAQATFTYALSSMPTGTAQLVSFDLNNPGWVDVYLKTGAGADTRLVSFKAATGTASFLNLVTGPTIFYIPQDPTWAQCSQVTGSAELNARILANGLPLNLTPGSPSESTCSSFIVSTFNSSTKIATLKYDTAAKAINHVFIVPNGGQNTPSGLTYGIYTSLNYNTTEKFFVDSLLSSANSSQQIYFIGFTAQDGKNIPKNSYYPIAGGIVDMTASDIDLGAKGVTMDTNSSTYMAVAHNVNTITKDGTFTLFVPYREGDTFVNICPGAATLNDVNNKCANMYSLKNGQTKTSKDTKGIPAGKSVKATIVTLGGVKFWQVDGVTGTGGFSTTSGAPDTGFGQLTNSPALVAYATLAGTLGIAYIARKYAYQTHRR